MQGEFCVTGHAGLTPDEAADGLFDGHDVQWLGCERFGETTTHIFMVEPKL